MGTEGMQKGDKKDPVSQSVTKNIVSSGQAAMVKTYKKFGHQGHENTEGSDENVYSPQKRLQPMPKEVYVVYKKRKFLNVKLSGRPF